MGTQASFELTAEARSESRGKAASRRLRRLENRIPGIVYGGDKEPLAITLDHKKLMHALENQAFYSHLLTLHVGKQKEQVILKSLQRHHYKKGVLHIDFQRVKSTDKIAVKVPLRFLNEDKCPGVKAGGIVSHRLIDVEIRCTANSLPDHLDVDLSELVLDQTLHLSELKLPKGAEIVALAHGQGPDHDHGVVSVHLPRRAEEPKETTEEAKPAESSEAAAADKDKGK